MCGESTTTQQGANTSESYLPGYLERAGRSITGSALDALKGGYQQYTGPTQGAFGSTFGTAEGAATARSGATDPNYAAGTSALTQGLGLAGKTASTPVSGLMSNYTDAALQPVLDALHRQSAANNQGLATSATMAGAFGDTGYGTQKATNAYNTDQAISGAVGSAYDKAYNTALSTQQTGLSQLLGGVGQASGLGSAQNTSATNLEALLGSLGSTKQQAAQTGINTAIGVNDQNQKGPPSAARARRRRHRHHAARHLFGQHQLRAENPARQHGTGTFGQSTRQHELQSDGFGGFNYGSPELASAARAGVESGLSFDPKTGDVW